MLALSRADFASYIQKFLGVGEDSPCFHEIVEGRKSWVKDGQEQHYSWCADFVTYCLMHVGVTDGSILNRAVLNGGKWVPSDNIARIWRWATKNGVLRAGDPMICQPGDVVCFARAKGDHLSFYLGPSGSNAFFTVDGNSYGHVVKRNCRPVSPGPADMALKWSVSYDAFPAGGSNPAAVVVADSLSPQEVAAGGDSDMLNDNLA